jgi:hypothetical protein
MSSSTSNNSTHLPLQPGILLVELDRYLLANRALLLARSKYLVATASSSRTISDLWWMTGIYLAVVSDTLGLYGIRSAVRAVRAQWPSARILILGTVPLALESHLYDDAVDHQFQPKDFLETLARLSVDPWTQRPKRTALNLGTSAHPSELLTYRQSQALDSDPSKVVRTSVGRSVQEQIKTWTDRDRSTRCSTSAWEILDILNRLKEG